MDPRTFATSLPSLQAFSAPGIILSYFTPVIMQNLQQCPPSYPWPGGYMMTMVKDLGV